MCKKSSFCPFYSTKTTKQHVLNKIILWSLLWHFNDCNEKRTWYPAANHVLYHNIIYSKHVVCWFLLNKMDKKDFLFDK